MEKPFKRLLQAQTLKCERRARQAALIQQWRLWKKSTGLRTLEGKAVASRNAYQNGGRSMLRELSRLLIIIGSSRVDAKKAAVHMVRPFQ
jgi:hypothetical protein